MDYGEPPDAPDYDDLEDLLEDLEEQRLVVDDVEIPSDLEDELLPTPPVTQTPQNQQSQRPPEHSVPASLLDGVTTTSSKRRLDDTLLSDITDVSLSEEDGGTKRPRTAAGPADAEANALMERIRLSRLMPSVEQFVPGSRGLPGERPRARISRRVPLDGAFQKVTLLDGERFYLRVRSSAPQEVSDPISKRTSLLSKSLEDLKNDARQLEERRLALRQEQDVLDKLASWEVESADSGLESEDESSGSALWAERFQPRSYVELLSEETINRGLLRWLKLWDRAVFGRDVVIKPPKEEKKKPDGKFKPFVRKPPFEVVEELDATNRPKQRVTLLCGPPGLGKTTLAHVLAKHAGYHAWEMNASDDRSVAAFRTALETATQMRPMLGQEPRPNCLVIDEIDGAPAPSISHLVSALSDTGAAAKSKKSRSATAPIHRPVICICNDPYTPALRPLRQMALVMTFPPTEPARLSGRLQEICRRNGLATDLAALLTLCERTRNDIRSCLSFLQFVRSRQDKLTLEQVQSSTVGEKDHHKGLFAAWHEIFNIPRPKRKHLVTEAGQAPRLTGDGTTLAERFRTVAQVLTSCGEYEKVVQGMFENYLNAKIKDGSMKTVALGADWLCFADELHTELQRTQNYVLMPYQVYPAVAFHLLFGSLQRFRTAMPTADSEARQRQTKISNLLATMVADMAPSARCFTGLPCLVQDVLPFLLKVVLPSLRPVNSQLFTSRETEELKRVLHLMISYNLTYRQQRDEDGQFQFTLEPNMDEVVYLTGQERPQKSAPYTVKQLIAREIEMEKLRRAEAALEAAEVRRPVRTTRQQAPKPPPPPPKPTEAAASSSQHPSDAASTEAAASSSSQPPSDAASTEATTEEEHVPNHLKQLKAKPITRRPENEAPRDFFGRVIQVKEVDPAQKEAEESDTGHLLRTDVWYHFKEGFNNAVRRVVRVKDLA